MNPNPSILVVAAVVAASVMPVVLADQPSPIESRKANRPEAAPEYGSTPPAGSAERAAQSLNRRDVREIEKRRRDGDDNPETRDGARIESTPDHPGENDGKP